MKLFSEKLIKTNYFSFLPAIHRVLMVAKTTTETELTGINMAANKGDKTAITAKLNPTILYKNEIKKLNRTILKLVFVNRIN